MNLFSCEIPAWCGKMIVELDKSWSRGEEATSRPKPAPVFKFKLSWSRVRCCSTQWHRMQPNRKKFQKSNCCVLLREKFSLSFKGIKCCPISVTFPENIVIKGFQLQQTFKCSEIFSFFRCVDAIETKSFYKKGFLFWYAALRSL